MKIHNSRKFLLEFSKTQKPLMAFDKSADFDEWKTKAKAKLQELLGLPFTECDDLFNIISTEEKKDYKSIVFEFQSEEGYFIEAEFLSPINQEKPLPVAVCLQGHTTGKHISLGQEKFGEDKKSTVHSDFAIQAIKNGYCAVIFDQRYMGTAGQDEAGHTECIVSNAVFPTLLMGRTPIGERVWDVKRVIDILEKYFTEYIDTQKIMCVGNSGGGTATFYSAVMDERIALAVPSCAVCSFDASIIPIYHCGCNFVPGVRKYFDMGDIGALVAPRKLVVVNGDEDEIFPLEGAKAVYKVIESAYEKVGHIENCCMVIGKGGHRFYGDDAWPKVNEML